MSDPNLHGEKAEDDIQTVIKKDIYPLEIGVEAIRLTSARLRIEPLS